MRQALNIVLGFEQHHVRLVRLPQPRAGRQQQRYIRTRSSQLDVDQAKPQRGSPLEMR